MCRCLSFCCPFSSAALPVPSFISPWILVLNEPVTKCVSLCFRTWVRSVIPARGAETMGNHILNSRLAFWDCFGLISFTHESTDAKAAELTDNHAAELTENNPPFSPPSFFLVASSLIRVTEGMVLDTLVCRRLSFCCPFSCFLPYPGGLRLKSRSLTIAHN